MLSTSMFDYVLPPELIAQHPAERRDGSRMLVLDRVTGECEIRPFGAIEEYISPGDALIYNDTKVLRGRMYARKNGQEEERNLRSCWWKLSTRNGSVGM